MAGNNNSIDLSKGLIADAVPNTNITSMSGITASLKAPSDISDANGKKQLEFTTTASAVSYFDIKNSATGTGVNFSAQGTDANLTCNLNAQNAGYVLFSSDASTTPLKLRPNSNTNTNDLSFDFPTLTADRTYTWPDITGTVVCVGVTDNITAHAGGGQASATILSTYTNRITTVASANDSVRLPDTQNLGIPFYIRNDGSNPMNLYNKSGASINGGAANSPISVAAGSKIIIMPTLSTNATVVSSS